MAVVNHLLFAHTRLVPVIATVIEHTDLVHGTPRWPRRFLQTNLSIALRLGGPFLILYTAAGDSHARQNIRFYFLQFSMA